jgi:hypothetical protein
MEYQIPMSVDPHHMACLLHLPAHHKAERQPNHTETRASVHRRSNHMERVDNQPLQASTTLAVDSHLACRRPVVDSRYATCMRLCKTLKLVSSHATVRSECMSATYQQRGSPAVGQQSCMEQRHMGYHMEERHCCTEHHQHLPTRSSLVSNALRVSLTC